jgi:hypothetical protein
MTNRLTLHQTLVDILGSGNVYYNPPESQKLNFPCIVYNLSYIEQVHADNKKYLDYTTYKITVISKIPDHPAIREILNLPMTKFSANFTKNGYYHTVITLIQKEKQ